MRKKVIYLLLFLLLGFYFQTDALSGESTSNPTVKNILLFIGDGMHLTHEIAASRYLTGSNRALVWHAFDYQTFMTTWDITTYNQHAKSLQKPAYSPDTFDPGIGYDIRQGNASPYPLESPLSDNYFLSALPDSADTISFNDRIPATDSAASATAMAIGTKVLRGSVAWHHNTRLPSICETLRTQRKTAIGIVTTDPFCHATPASFVCHNRDRTYYYSLNSSRYGIGIAGEMLSFARPDVLIGGGHPYLNNPEFKQRRGYISKQLYRQMQRSNEYVFVEYQPKHNGAAELQNAAEQAVNEQKKLFGLFGGKNGIMSLSQIHIKDDAVRLKNDSLENPSLAQATGAALTVLSTHPSGFFLLVEQGIIDRSNTTHNYRQMVRAVTDLQAAVTAAIDFVDQPNDDINWENTLLIVTSDHAGGYIRFNNNTSLKKGVLPKQKFEHGTWTFPDNELSYGTSHHTNELVSLYAKGAYANVFSDFEGRWYPHTRIIDNTHIYHALKKAAAVQ